MNFERGIRRLFVVVSCAIGATSATAVGFEVWGVAHYQAERRAHARREESFQAWLAQHPITDAQVKAHQPLAKLPLKKAIDNYLAGPDAVESELRWEHARGSGLEQYVNPPYARRPWWDWPLTRVVLLGVGATIGLTALPWGLFYLVRWIVQGFLLTH